jgi:hypothetical protein
MSRWSSGPLAQHGLGGAQIGPGLALVRHWRAAAPWGGRSPPPGCPGTGTPVPRSLPSGCPARSGCSPSNNCTAKRPMARMILGCTSAISRCRYCAHCASSAGCGNALPCGGRHLTTLVTVSALPAPCAPLRLAPTALSMLSSSSAGLFDKGLALARSSSSSGGSPTTSQSASALWNPAWPSVTCLCGRHTAGRPGSGGLHHGASSAMHAQARPSDGIQRGGCAPVGQSARAPLGRGTNGAEPGYRQSQLRVAGAPHPHLASTVGGRSAAGASASRAATRARPSSASMARWRLSRSKQCMAVHSYVRRRLMTTASSRWP